MQLKQSKQRCTLPSTALINLACKFPGKPFLVFTIELINATKKCIFLFMDWLKKLYVYNCLKM